MINRSLPNRESFSEMERMADAMDRAFDAFWGWGNKPTSFGNGTVPVDIYERDNNLYVVAAVPGVAPGELDISLERNVLTIRGEIKPHWEASDQTKVYRREHRYGVMTRSIRLPEGLELEKIDAEFNNGFVSIQIPKVQLRQPEIKKIQVRSVEQAPDRAPDTTPDQTGTPQALQEINSKGHSRSREAAGVA